MLLPAGVVALPPGVEVFDLMRGPEKLTRTHREGSCDLSSQSNAKLGSYLQ